MIMEMLDDEALWERSFRERPDLLRVLAEEARDEHRRGKRVHSKNFLVKKWRNGIAEPALNQVRALLRD